MTALLTRLANAFGAEHPAAVARFIEGMDEHALSDFLSELTVEVAARVVARSLPLAIVGALEHMDRERAKGLLSALDPRVVATLLGRMPSEARARLLAALPAKVAEPVVRMLDYAPGQAASRMDPLTPTVHQSCTVERAIAAVRQAPEHTLYYVYIVDEQHRLIGVVNMRELMSAPAGSSVAELMRRQPECVHAEDPIDGVARHPAWRRVHALPVVDGEGRFLGAIRYATFRTLEAEAGRALSGPDPARTASALAELFWLGASAGVRTAEAALLGDAPRTRKDVES